MASDVMDKARQGAQKLAAGIGGDGSTLAQARATILGPINVGPKERVASLIAGGGLLYGAVKVGSWKGLALGGAAASLLVRGVTGYCGMYARLGINTADRGGTGRGSQGIA